MLTHPRTLASERTSIHKNLVVAIGLAQIVFLAGIDAIYNPVSNTVGITFPSLLSRTILVVYKAHVIWRLFFYRKKQFIASPFVHRLAEFSVLSSVYRPSYLSGEKN